MQGNRWRGLRSRVAVAGGGKIGVRRNPTEKRQFVGGTLLPFPLFLRDLFEPGKGRIGQGVVGFETQLGNGGGVDVGVMSAGHARQEQRENKEGNSDRVAACQGKLPAVPDRHR